MIEFKKIFGILLVLASGFASGAAQDGNVREGKRRIVEDDAGVPVAAALPVAVPVVPAPVKANGGARRAKLGSFKRQRAAEPLPVPVAVLEPDTGDLTEEDFVLDPAEFAFLKVAAQDSNVREEKRRIVANGDGKPVPALTKSEKYKAYMEEVKANPERLEAYKKKQAKARARYKAKIDADPEAAAAYRKKQAKHLANHRAKIAADPLALEKKRKKNAEYLAKRRKEIAADPEALKELRKKNAEYDAKYKAKIAADPEALEKKRKKNAEAKARSKAKIATDPEALKELRKKNAGYKARYKAKIAARKAAAKLVAADELKI